MTVTLVRNLHEDMQTEAQSIQAKSRAVATARSEKASYPPPADVGEPPDVIREWADKVIESWHLTKKELEVCHLMLKGLSTKEMAEVTGNTDKTLKHHIAQIFLKAHVGSRGELFAEILRL